MNAFGDIPVVKTILIPTPNIQEYSAYYLVQLLARQRAISILENTAFMDISPRLVEQYLQIPPSCQTAEAVANFIKSESVHVFQSFNQFEEDPLYRDALLILKNYEGMPYSVNSVTTSGIMILITVPELSK